LPLIFPDGFQQPPEQRITVGPAHDGGLVLLLALCDATAAEMAAAEIVREMSLVADSNIMTMRSFWCREGIKIVRK